MHRYDPKPLDIRRCDMVRAEDGEFVYYDDAQAEIERLTKELDEAIHWRDHYQKELGIERRSFQRRAEALWHPIYSKARADAEKAEAERDEARAQVAAAYEAAAKECSLAATKYLGKGADTDLGSRSRAICDVSLSIRAMTPADAKAALEAYGREKVREGYRRAAEVARECWNDPQCEADAEYIPNAILAAMETLK